ncbi:MAG: hypothetical protein JST45_01740 [Bacteroidetes bacterium]|nr:hypothetical protein [Bacteroidota bacterium]
MLNRLAIALLLLTAGASAFASEPCKNQPCPADSAAVVEAIHTIEPWIGEQINALHAAINPAEVRGLAHTISLRTDSLARRFRQVFPEEDDGWIMASAYNGLATALDATNPGAGTPYRAIATAFQYSDPAPYRPAMYQALRSISDRAWSLARAKNPQRAARLLEKLDADRVDLVVAL